MASINIRLTPEQYDRFMRSRVQGRVALLQFLKLPPDSMIELLEYEAPQGVGQQAPQPNPQREGPLVRITYRDTDNASNSAGPG